MQAIYKEIVNNEFDYVYFLKFDGNINELALQEEEVAKIQFLSIDKIEKELKEYPDKYVPHGDYWFDVIKKVRENTK